MTLVVIGPVTNDLVVIGEQEFQKVGGATYYQSFVFEKFYKDYLAIVNCSDSDLVNDFPNSDKVKVVLKDDTHYFVNRYPFEDNLDIREQSSNFADIPILRSDLENILPDEIDGFVLNPLNRYDFPAETIEFLKSFDVPIFLSIQGFLRLPGIQINENYTIKLDNFGELSGILSGVTAIFLDEAEANIIDGCFDVDEMVITNGSHGSRIVSEGEIKIEAVKCENVVDTTGCGDTYMAAYISKRLTDISIEKSGRFASKIASEKLKNHGHY
ncbi:PfkB family carbohydrate kinase [Methanobrevibacter sp.]|uniref:PfkB family carbohydrate kinase n=1 Tax=Methanobrevibacter sp. TaxID=66852 RepID=UPI00386CF2B4